MYILDTDHLTLLQRKAPAADKILARLSGSAEATFYTTIITYEEQTRGWFGFLAQAKTPAEQIRAYRKLSQHLEIFCMLPIMNFDEAAAEVFQRLQKIHRRVGTMDLKIAAIALAQDAVLLTRNVADFRQFGELKIEDWSA